MRGIKRMLLIAFAMMLLLSLSGCCIRHDWVEATCEVPKTCSKCGKTEGEALGHEWVEATCEAPKTCSRCGKTEGEALGHKWVEATCENPKTCSVCGKTEGEALGHKWLENTPNYQQPKTCEVCGATEGEPLEAAWAGYQFAELDKVYDVKLKWSNNPPDRQDAKMWFTNYKVFDSDETHEAVDGYEYRSVEAWCAGCVDGWSIGVDDCDYYTDKEFRSAESGELDSVSYLGRELTYDGANSEYIKDFDRFIIDSQSDYSKWGWTGYALTVSFTVTKKVPKGYDGWLIELYDRDEGIEKTKDWSQEKLDFSSEREICESTLENCIVFRAD